MFIMEDFSMKNKVSLVELKINDIIINTEDKERNKLSNSNLKIIIKYDADNILKENTRQTRLNQIYTLLRFAKIIGKPFKQSKQRKKDFR